MCHPYQFTLRVRSNLEMETAYDAPGVGQRVVVLHEVDIGNDLPEKAAIVRLAEEAACIAHNPRGDEPRVGYCERFNFHMRCLPDPNGII
jgi:hypothetical protein